MDGRCDDCLEMHETHPCEYDEETGQHSVSLCERCCALRTTVQIRAAIDREARDVRTVVQGRG